MTTKTYSTYEDHLEAAFKVYAKRNNFLLRKHRWYSGQMEYESDDTRYEFYAFARIYKHFYEIGALK